MKKRMRWCFWVFLFISTQLSGTALAAEGKIIVMNPRGIMPAIKRIPMAPRPATLDGKTIYIVDTKFANTKPFVNAVRANLAAKYPETHWVSVDKAGGYMQDDPKLWAEIKAKGDGAIVLLGH
jgi:hypothetical protein